MARVYLYSRESWQLNRSKVDEDHDPRCDVCCAPITHSFLPSFLPSSLPSVPIAWQLLWETRTHARRVWTKCILFLIFAIHYNLSYTFFDFFSVILLNAFLFELCLLFFSTSSLRKPIPALFSSIHGSPLTLTGTVNRACTGPSHRHTHIDILSQVYYAVQK